MSTVTTFFTSSLVLRHGNYCIIDGTYFIGDDNPENIGGIRVVNTGHWIYNNYFFNLKGSNFRSALAVMNGIPKITIKPLQPGDRCGSRI